MPGKAAKVIVTEKQKAILEAFARSRSESVSLVQRSKIILLAFEGRNNETIEGIVGLQHDSVGRWRRRWRDNWERLIDIECSEELSILRTEMKSLLADRKRSGRPPQITSEQQAAIFKTACEDPKKTIGPLRGGVEANFAST